jgi:hypothetical protein
MAWLLISSARSIGKPMAGTPGGTGIGSCMSHDFSLFLERPGLTVGMIFTELGTVPALLELTR